MVPNQDIYFIQDNYFFPQYHQWYHGTTGVSDNIYFIQDYYFFHSITSDITGLQAPVITLILFRTTIFFTVSPVISRDYKRQW